MSATGSIQSDVPVKPVCPTETLDILRPQDDVGSIVSQPSALELFGVDVLLAKYPKVDRETSLSSPRKLPSICCANLPTPRAVPNRPACPATPPKAQAFSS